MDPVRGRGTEIGPYFDDDFEVFVNAAQDNYYYVEYEMNANNATYNVLWSLLVKGVPAPPGGLAARPDPLALGENGPRHPISIFSGNSLPWRRLRRRPGEGVFSADLRLKSRFSGWRGPQKAGGGVRGGR